ncbi:MAG: hypothetical protein HGB06_04655 [Chlorobaculum sp.]|nr:hypothetical protein [Chlorobaculum sp.]
MPHIEELTAVPESEVAEVVSDFESEGAKVEKIKQRDGNWTVRATFAD